MKSNPISLTLQELATKLGLPFSGNTELQVTHTCGLDSLSPGGLAYMTNSHGLSSVRTPSNLHQHNTTKLDEINSDQTALIVPVNLKNKDHNLLFASDPLDMHVRATRLLHPEKSIAGASHPTAVIGENVTLGKDVFLGPHVVLYDNISIGDRTIVHAGTVLMNEVQIGQDCVLYPNVVVQDRCIVGNRVLLQTGAVIGADGHGYYQRADINHKIPQIGIVRIEDDVEIGACTTIDRARFTETVIEKGCKIDNQVQIAHNVVLAEQALISAQSAIGGSAKIGHHLILGGQAGIRDNVKIGNHVTAIARAVITSNTRDNALLGGMPSRPVSQWRKAQALIHRLDELFDRLKKIEKVIFSR